jgi:hypothetical protein
MAAGCVIGLLIEAAIIVLPIVALFWMLGGGAK